ncbi:unnamed protein product [Musa textilis]
MGRYVCKHLVYWMLIACPFFFFFFFVVIVVYADLPSGKIWLCYLEMNTIDHLGGLPLLFTEFEFSYFWSMCQLGRKVVYGIAKCMELCLYERKKMDKDKKLQYQRFVNHTFCSYR